MTDGYLIESGADERPEPHPWTNVRQWVAAAGVSTTARAVYETLRMLVWAGPGNDVVELTTEELAALVDLSRGDKVKRYVDELVAIGAVKVTQNGRGQANSYKVYELPPDSYTGPVMMLQRLKDYRKAAKALKASRPAEPLERGDGRMAGTPASTADASPPAGTPKRGDGDRAPERGDERAPVRGDGRAPSRGDICSNGFEETELTLPSLEDPQPAAAAVAEAVPGGKDQLSDEESTADAGSRGLRAAVTYIREIRPTWKAYAVQKALVEAVKAGRTHDHALAALTALARDLTGSRYGVTDVPGRLNAMTGAWWADTAPKAPATPPQPRGPRCHRHPDHVAGRCELCEAEAPARPLGDDVDPAAAAKARVAKVAAARAKVAEAAEAARAVRRATERPAALAWLREETGELPAFRPDPDAADAVDEIAS